MIATQSIASDVQLRVPTPASPSNVSDGEMLDHQDTILISDENQQPANNRETKLLSPADLPDCNSTPASNPTNKALPNKSTDITKALALSPPNKSSKVKYGELVVLG